MKKVLIAGLNQHRFWRFYFSVYSLVFVLMKIYQTLETVFYQLSKHLDISSILRCASYFQLFSRCLDQSRWNTIARVWFITWKIGLLQFLMKKYVLQRVVWNQSVTCSALDSIFIEIEVMSNIRSEVFVSQVSYKPINLMSLQNFTTHTCYINRGGYSGRGSCRGAQPPPLRRSLLLRIRFKNLFTPPVSYAIPQWCTPLSPSPTRKPIAL